MFTVNSYYFIALILFGQFSYGMEQSQSSTIVDDRLTASCPPEAFEEEPLPCPSNGGNCAVLEDGFVIQRPECPGETERDRPLYSRECSTVVGDELTPEKEEPPPIQADAFGFFLKNGTLLPQRQIDVSKLRKREKKWLQMFDNWRFFMDNKYDKVRDRCRKGIPPSIRGRAWKFLCGAVYHMEVSNNRHVFDKCVQGEVNPKWADDIEKDLNRQFPEHEMFARTGRYGENGREDLATLLRAWTVLFPEEGYCQGQAPIASVLLMHMPLRDAFYCFVQICVRYLPGYYSAGLEAVQVDGDILVQLLKDKCNISYRHLKKNNVDPVLYMIEWFMCIFCRTLPWPTVLRIWDMFFCEGVKVLFKVALVLFKYGLGSKEQCKQYPDLHSIVTRLKNLPEHILSEDFLIQKVCELNIDDAELEKMHFRTMKLRQMRIPQK